MQVMNAPEALKPARSAAPIRIRLETPRLPIHWEIKHLGQRSKKRQIHHLTKIILLALSLFLLLPAAWALYPQNAAAHDPADDVCPRPAPASVAAQPPEIRSQNGRLELTLNFKIASDNRGRVRFCYMTESGLQGPTLRVNPGDELVIHFHNQLPGTATPQHAHAMGNDSAHCAGERISLAATNVHFHGLSIPPTCHEDDVMNTLVEPSTTFDYRFKIPADASPGLYWYHPHPHPFSEKQVQGGASGALIVEGIGNVHRELVGLPERILMLRDQIFPMGIIRTGNPNEPSWDISLNYVPVLYPKEVPAIIQTNPHRKEFWRVLNAAADTIFDLQVLVNNVPQPLRVIAIDGVPIEARQSAASLTQTDVVLPPGSRVEFVMTTPKMGENAQLVTKAWDTGPDGDKDTSRTIANIVSVSEPLALETVKPSKEIKATKANLVAGKRVAGASSFAAESWRMDERTSLLALTPAAERKLYFSEIRRDPKNFGDTSFFLTVDGKTPKMFQMDDPPDIVARQGTVEDWTIENRSREEHVFHIHQVHFQVLDIDGKPVHDPALRDTIDVPYWKGSGPYPSAKLRMDFRDPNIVGTFMYHCHLLQHSDGGMMGTIQVLPQK